MKGCTNWSWLFVAAVFTAILSCARVAAPSGGPADVTPPKIAKSVPLNSSRNYKGKSIVITFDEYVVLDKMNEKFMVSPPVNNKPEIFLRGKSLNIEFQEELKDSTTYTLYFQDAIRDLNAGNPIMNFQFVFSTGNVLDSLSVTGNVFNSSDLEVTENTQISMYRHLADTAPIKLLPDYISLADINGGFRINNAKEGTYRLYALQDKNNNKKLDSPDESVAFMDKPVEINHINNYLPIVVIKDTAKVSPTLKKAPPIVPLFDGMYKLFLFNEPKKNHYLSSSGRKTANLLTYILSLPPDSIKFEFLIPDGDKKSYYIENNITGDSIYIWLIDSLLYSKQEISTLAGYPFTDSTGVTKLRTDTINMRFLTTKATRAKEAMSKYTFSTSIAGSLKPGQQILFSSPTPFRAPDTTKIRLYESGKSGSYAIPYSFIKDTVNSRRYTLKTKLKEGASYLFVADSGSFGNIYGDVADSMGIKFSVRMPDSYGRLTMNIKNVSGSVIIQLLDHKEKVVSEKPINKDASVEFPLLERGNYRVRAIYDLNGDGKWTTGKYETKLQPEPVSYFSGEIEIRVDFQIVQDWDIGKRNEKDQKLRTKKDQTRQ